MHGALKILVLGDSLTVGYLVPVGYVEAAGRELAAQGLAVEFINMGRCGDTVRQGAQRLAAARLPGIELMVIQFGINDCFSGLTPLEFKRDLEQLVVQARKLAVEKGIILIPPPPVGEPAWDRDLEPFREACGQVARSLDLGLVTFPQTWPTSPYPWLSDLIHPSVHGYELIGAGLVESIRRIF